MKLPVARAIAEAIWDDMTGRGGMDLDIDDETMEEILDTWAGIIMKGAPPNS